jgi:sugar fermentation stimulation protein A
MHFPKPLISGILIKRYKRFMADVQLDDGREITAHVANSGGMLGVKEPGMRVWLSHHDSATRKYPYSWELAEVDGSLVGVNTSHPNRLVEEAILSGIISELQGYPALRREVKYGVNSRIDLLLEGESGPSCYVEVKNVHLKRGDQAQFPDAVTERGAKHLRELKTMVEQGHRSVMIYVIQREDVSSFSFAADIDPTYAATAAEAMQNGVEAYAYQCELSTSGIWLRRKISLVHLT